MLESNEKSRTAALYHRYCVTISYHLPPCGFYSPSLLYPSLLILSLVLFTIAGKRYKLRERERHVNIQAIAEEHYERYLDQEEEYRRENNTDNITVISS